MKTQSRNVYVLPVLLSLLASKAIAFQTSGPINAGQTIFPTLLKSTDGETSTEEKFNGQALRPDSLAAATKKYGRVPYGESSRKYRRTVFNYDSWVDHRSNERIWSNLKGMFFSGIVRQLQKEVSIVAFISTTVVVWNSILVPKSEGVLPNVCLPVAPFTLSAAALGLLLVFRTNASYGRWMEARVTWGKIVAQSRNIVRMSATFSDFSDPESEKTLTHLSRAAWAFPRSVMNSLSGPEDEAPFEEEMRKEFENDESSDFLPYILDAPDRPLLAMMELSLALDAITIDEKRRVEIDKSLVINGDLLSGCERIFTTPVPLVYTRHTARFLTLWMLLLPLALYEEFGKMPENAYWLGINGLPLIPAASLLSLFLFGIEELAVQLEEPFSILPMQKFCDGVKTSNERSLEWAVLSSNRKLKMATKK